MDDLWIDPGGTARASLNRAREGDEARTVLPAALVLAAREFDLDEADLALGAELQRLMPSEEHRGALVGLVAALRLASREGSTRMPLPDPVRFRKLQLGAAEQALALALLRAPAEFAPVAGPAPVRAPLVIDGSHLYSHAAWKQETRVAESLRARLSLPHLAQLPVSEFGPFPLSGEQRLAVQIATSAPLTIVSGGPGTGKTSIVVSILKTLIDSGMGLERVALCAPTGKAADRMRRSIVSRAPELGQASAMTLHRLLGFSVRRRGYRFHEDNPLGVDVLIVDESSMIDLAMFDHLLRAMRAETRLILLGDADQLPSVDSGAVFRDLCAALSERDVSLTLTESFRMKRSDPHGSQVYTVAQEANRGGPLASLQWRAEAGELQMAGAEAIPADQLDALLDLWWSDAKPEPTFALRRYEAPFSDADRPILQAGFEHADRMRLLSVTRRRQTGTERLNEALHAKTDASSKRHWAFGEPVMVRRNDYDLGLFNGDQGIVLRVGGTRCAVFRGDDEGFRAFPLDLIGANLELAWCITVHKAQGSEFDRIALVLPREETPLATREVIYTAISRARKSAVIVGDSVAMRRFLGRSVTRDSGLGERL